MLSVEASPLHERLYDWLVPARTDVATPPLPVYLVITMYVRSVVYVERERGALMNFLARLLHPWARLSIFRFAVGSNSRPIVLLEPTTTQTPRHLVRNSARGPSGESKLITIILHRRQETVNWEIASR